MLPSSIFFSLIQNIDSLFILGRHGVGIEKIVHIANLWSILAQNSLILYPNILLLSFFVLIIWWYTLALILFFMFLFPYIISLVNGVGLSPFMIVVVLMTRSRVEERILFLCWRWYTEIIFVLDLSAISKINVLLCLFAFLVFGLGYLWLFVILPWFLV